MGTKLNPSTNWRRRRRHQCTQEHESAQVQSLKERLQGPESLAHGLRWLIGESGMAAGLENQLDRLIEAMEKLAAVWDT